MGTSNRVDQRVEKVLQVMRDDLRRELSLTGLAHSVNLSVWRLSHVFRAEVGMSPIQYLKILRIEKARHLLETSFLSVKEITHIVGLKDESHFVRDFKKAYGLSPTPYRLSRNGAQPKKSENGNGAESKDGKQIADVLERLPVPLLAFCSSLLACLEVAI